MGSRRKRSKWIVGGPPGPPSERPSKPQPDRPPSKRTPIEPSPEELPKRISPDVPIDYRDDVGYIEQLETDIDALIAGEDPKVIAARTEERRRLRRMRGRGSTILTGPQGLLGSAPIQRKTLLGR